MTRYVTLLLALTLTTGVSFAEIYQWRDENGQVHFGDRPPADAKTETVEVKVNSYQNVEVVYNPDWFYKPKPKAGPTPVTMYSAKWCGVCKKAKKYFSSNNIPYQEYDIDKSAKGKKDFAKLKGTGVPIILIGNQRMNGFSPNQFESIYFAKNKQPKK